MDLRDDPLRRRRPGRDDHAQPAGAAQHDRAADARRGRGRGRRGRSRDRDGEGDRAARGGPLVLRRLRLRRRLQGLGRARSPPTGEWDPGKDFAFATAPQLAPTQKLMSVWRAPKPVIAQVHGWCVGGGSDFALCADLVDRLRGRADRHALLAHVGRVPVGHVDLPARPHAHEVPRADRPAAVGARGRRRRADQRGGPVRGARGDGGGARRRARARSRHPSSRR